jgi:hypothetical protein
MVGRLGVPALLVGLLLIGCVTARPRDLQGGADILAEDEINALHVASAYDVVTRTRPAYLHSRGREYSSDSRLAPIPAHVFMDDTYYGDINTLRSVPASQLAQVRFYQSYEAQYKFGSDHMGGVIQLITKQ